MSLKSSIEDELKRSPVAALSGAVGAVASALSLILAVVQYRAGSPPSAQFPDGISPLLSGIVLGNVFLVVAYFLGVTVTGAIVIRVVARKHEFAALFASIPLVALTNFSTILVMYLAPPRAMSTQVFTSAHDLVLYASAAIYISLCGYAVVRDIATSGAKKSDQTGTEVKGSGGDVLAALFFALVLLLLWGSLVLAGQTRLTRTLLPEITHPIEVKAPNSEPKH
jgi:hypothetical protein